MKPQTGVILCVIIFILIVLGTGAYFSTQTQTPPEDIACTLEALICPDGSGVGRGGPECSFSPCPHAESFIGTLIMQGDAYRLVIPSPEGVGTGVTYALPLEIKSIDAGQYVNRSVLVRGSFTEGSTYHVQSIEPSTLGTNGGDTTTVIKLGESKLLSGVKITPLRVIEDSRCPTDVTCIWAGQIVVETELQSDTDHEITTFVGGSEGNAFDSYMVTLTDVQPEPVSERAPGPGAYEFTYTVRKLGT